MSLSTRPRPDRAASAPLCTFAALTAITAFSAFSPMAHAADTTVADNSTAVSAGTVTGRIDYVAGQLSAASGALESAAPSISKLAGKVVTRTI